MTENRFIIAGEILSTGMEKEEVEFRIQDALDLNTSGFAQVLVNELKPDKVLLEIDREFIIDPNKKIVYDRDMALLTGYDILLFQPYPIGEAMLYPLELDVAQKAFYTDVTAFLRFYKFMLFQIVGQGASDLGIRCFSDKILFQFIF